MLDEACESGFIPNHTFQTYKSLDRTAPPIVAHFILKLYRQFGGRELLVHAVDKLAKWMDWLQANKTTHRNGLLELGFNPYPDDVYVHQLEKDHSAGLQGAKWESELDNSPVYDDAAYGEGTHTIHLADVGFNSLYASSLRAVAEMAGVATEDHASRLVKEHILNEREFCGDPTCFIRNTSKP